jgi:hypothetical protein
MFENLSSEISVQSDKLTHKSSVQQNWREEMAFRSQCSDGNWQET